MSAKKQPSLPSKPRSATAVSPANVSPTKQASAALRTLRARLQVLKRPMVWGSLLLLLLPLLFLANYWNSLADEAGATANSPDASADLASETALDAVPEAIPGTLALPPLPDFLSGLLPAPERKPAGDAKPQPSPSKPVQAASAAAVPALPAVGVTSSVNRTAAAQNSSLFSNLAASSGKSVQSNSVQGNSAQGNLAQATVNPLQAALDRRAGVNSADQTGSNAASPAQSSGAQSSGVQFGNVTQIYEFGASTGSQAFSPGQVLPGFGQPFVPQTSPAAGTTGYTLPPALRTPTGATTGAATGAATPQLLPTIPTLQPTQLPAGTPPNRAGGYSSTVPAPTVVAPAPQVPFSVPRVPPGRYIGNGEINTFSNP